MVFAYPFTVIDRHLELISLCYCCSGLFCVRVVVFLTCPSSNVLPQGGENGSTRKCPTPRQQMHVPELREPGLCKEAMTEARDSVINNCKDRSL